MIAVAHRLATVQNADVIFVLGEGGKLLERGCHLELLRKRGVYYQMVSLRKHSSLSIETRLVNREQQCQNQVM